MSHILNNHLKPAWGAIEAGGTKFNCVLADEHNAVLAHTRITTRPPDETLKEAAEFFRQPLLGYSLQSLGIASFGPVELNPQAKQYGFITNTPKPGWAHTDMVGYFKRALALPIGFQTDVNAAAIGEWHFGAAQGCRDFVYVTIGTGIGAGIISAGELLQGISHPEVGHMFIPPKSLWDTFQGSCPFHKNCLEGLASGPAMAARWNLPAEELTADHPAWVLEAHYLALMCANLTLILAPQKIILGGGVMQHSALFPLVREQFASLLAGYGQGEELNDLNSYIVPAGRPEQSGVLGALILARAAASV